MDRGAWQATVHGIAKSRTQLSDFTSLHLNGLVVFPTFFNLSLNFAIKSSHLSHSQLLVLFLLTV